MAEKQACSFRVRMGLKKAKEAGKTLGRHRTVDRGQVMWLREKGMSVRQIAKEMGCAKSTVSKVISNKSGAS